jgi:hypothetical protein
MSIKIYGASDDLIEIEGDLEEEFNHYSDEPVLIAVSEGTLLRVVYDGDGIWRITKVTGGSATMEKIEGDVEKDTNDVVTLSGVDFKWVVMCENVDHGIIRKEKS